VEEQTGDSPKVDEQVSESSPVSEIKEEEVKERKELIATIRKSRNRDICVYAVFSEIE
jgi:hypothetical protein